MGLRDSGSDLHLCNGDLALPLGYQDYIWRWSKELINISINGASLASLNYKASIFCNC